MHEVVIIEPLTVLDVAPQTDEHCAWVEQAADVQNRRLRAFYELWDARRDGRPMPARSDFTVTDFGPWLGHILIVDNVHSREDIRFRLFGSKLTEIFGIDMTRMTVVETAILFGDQPLIEYEEVARSRRPIYTSRFSPAIRKPIQLDKLILPLASDYAVDQIMAVIYPSSA